MSWKDISENRSMSIVELMLLGFMSLLLTVGEQLISKICISKKVAYSMLPCDKKKVSVLKFVDDEMHRKLLWASMSSNEQVPWRHVLASIVGGQDHCSQKVAMKSHVLLFCFYDAFRECFKQF